jgi:two-component system CheB/CheR fusion protein
VRLSLAVGAAVLALALGRTASRRVRSIAGVARNIAERRRAQHALRESERRFRSLVEQVKDYAIFMTDPQGRATTWNEGVRRVLGYEEAEFLGLDVTEHVFPPEDRARGVGEQEFQQALRTGAASNDRWLMRKDGTRFFASGITTAQRDGDGTPIGFSKVLRDLTEWKHADEALRQADRRKNEFLGMLAHELRNPLAPIRNSLYILRLALQDQNPHRPETVRQALDIMDRQVQHMVRLVDDLLEVSRITQGKITLRMRPVALAQVVEQALEATRSSIEAAHHRLEVSVPPEALWVNGDLTRLAQAVANLLSNAAKFTPEPGLISVAVARDMGGGVLRIRDSGIGIPPELLGSVFDPFVQADQSIDRGQGGLGIGLTLVRRLVEMHGGVVLAASEGAGRGSEFVVRLPLLPPERQPLDELPLRETGG